MRNSLNILFQSNFSRPDAVLSISSTAPKKSINNSMKKNYKLKCKKEISKHRQLQESKINNEINATNAKRAV